MAAVSRLALTLATVMVVLAGCVERQTVYRDGPRYSVHDDDERTFRRGRGVCDADERVCYKNGWPHRGATRKVFGEKTARRARWD